jgi:hypothetical protein
MASWFAKDYCLTPLEAGEVIMGDLAVVSEERKVEFRNEHNEVLEGTYEPGETLFAHIDDEKGQFVFDLGGDGALFPNKGGCEGKRVADLNDVLVKMPWTGEVTLKAGWSTGHMQVKITPTITLKPSREVPKMTIGKLRGASDAKKASLKIGEEESASPSASIFPEEVQTRIALLSIFLFGLFILGCSYCLKGSKGLTKAAKSV